VDVPIGDKTNKKYEPHIWVVKGNNEIILAYLKCIFNSEASVYKTMSGKKEHGVYVYSSK